MQGRVAVWEGVFASGVFWFFFYQVGNRAHEWKMSPTVTSNVCRQFPSKSHKFQKAGADLFTELMCTENLENRRKMKSEQKMVKLKALKIQLRNINLTSSFIWWVSTKQETGNR